MNVTEVVVRGVLKPDGTLELAEKPALQEGPVEVTIRTVTAPAARQESLMEFFQRAHAELAAAGHKPRTKEEIDADVRAFRDEWENRFKAIERLQDENRRAAGEPGVVTYLDSNIVIYSVEGSPVFGPKAEARLTVLRAAGEPLAVSELSRMECCTLPLARGDFQALRLFDDFFALPDVSLLSITPTVFRRATVIRATHGYEAVDAIHLATAVEGGCQTFLTHDTRLSGFPDVTVEILT